MFFLLQGLNCDFDCFLKLRAALPLHAVKTFLFGDEDERAQYREYTSNGSSAKRNEADMSKERIAEGDGMRTEVNMTSVGVTEVTNREQTVT